MNHYVILIFKLFFGSKTFLKIRVILTFNVGRKCFFQNKGEKIYIWHTISIPYMYPF